LCLNIVPHTAVQDASDVAVNVTPVCRRAGECDAPVGSNFCSASRRCMD